MARWGNIDPSALGPQNEAALRHALSQKIDPRLLPEPTNLEGIREEEVQADIIADLRARSYRVLQASVRYRMVRCENCRHIFYNHSDTGQTPGIPDLLVRSDEWQPGGLWLGTEVKSSKGKKPKLSKEQVELLAADGIVVARSVSQALEMVRAIDAKLIPQLRGAE